MNTIRIAEIFLVFAVFSISINSQKIPLEKVYEDNEYQFVSVAVSKTGRMFVGYPYWSDKHKYSVVEVMADGTVKPFPDETWNSWQFGESGKSKWVCAQAVYIDDENNLWVVDPASPFMQGVVDNSNKVVKFNLERNTVDRIYYFENFTGSKSYINDIRIDNKEQFAYLTNSNEGGIVVLNLKNGEGREVLKKHPSVMADSTYEFDVEGKRFADSSGPVRINSDGIELSKDGVWLYYKALTDDHLYRIETVHLRTAMPDVIAKKVHYLGRISTTDGMMLDNNGRLYLGDIETSTIYRYNPATGEKDALIINNLLLSWPDTYSITADGWMYVTCSHIHLMPKYNNGVDMRTIPYTIYKFKLPSVGE